MNCNEDLRLYNELVGILHDYINIEVGPLGMRIILADPDKNSKKNYYIYYPLPEEICHELKTIIYELGGRKMKVVWYKLKRLNGQVLYLQSEANMLQYIKEHNIKVETREDHWFFEVK